MAKAKTETKAKTKPATKKPSKPAKVKIEKVKPVVLKVLKPDGKMTEKKLKRHTAHDISSFLLSYSLIELLSHDGRAMSRVLDDIDMAICPPGYFTEKSSIKPFAIGKNGKIELLINTKVLKEPPEPTTAEGEQPSTPVADAEMPLEVPASEIPAAEPCAMAPDAAATAVAPVTAPEYKFEPVIAEVVSDDHIQKASFDAQDWFKQATDEDILELAREGYSHDFTSDNVARFFRETNEDVKRVFDYLDTIKDVPSKKDVNGFGCTVDEDQAITWVDANRPHLMDQLAAIKDGQEEPKADE